MSSDDAARKAPDDARRRLLRGLGTGAVAAAIGVPLALSVRSCVPNALYEPPRRFKAGPRERFAEGATFLPAERVYVMRQGNQFHCVSAICTHLGCTVQLLKTETGASEFHCPCHGSKYREDGTNFAGPAPRPLDHHPIEIAADDGQLEVDLAGTVDKGYRLKL